MRFKSTRTDRLSSEEREIVDRFERGVIDAAEAGRLLIASAEAALREPASVGGHGAAIEQTDDALPDETSEEARARALVERIAQDVYDDPA